MFYFKLINSFLVWDASLLVTVSSRQCLDMIGGKIENGLDVVLLKLNYLLITDPRFLLRQLKDDFFDRVFCDSVSLLTHFMIC